jgi:hypothetical protein
VSWHGAREGSVLVGANLTSETESDPRPRELVSLGKPVRATNANQAADAFNDWTWLLAVLASLLFVFDVFWFTRTRRVPSGVGERPKLPERPAALR